MLPAKEPSTVAFFADEALKTTGSPVWGTVSSDQLAASLQLLVVPPPSHILPNCVVSTLRPHNSISSIRQPVSLKRLSLPNLQRSCTFSPTAVEGRLTMVSM